MKYHFLSGKQPECETTWFTSLRINGTSQGITIRQKLSWSLQITSTVSTDKWCLVTNQAINRLRTFGRRGVCTRQMGRLKNRLRKIHSRIYAGACTLQMIGSRRMKDGMRSTTTPGKVSRRVLQTIKESLVCPRMDTIADGRPWWILGYAWLTMKAVSRDGITNLWISGRNQRPFLLAQYCTLFASQTSHLRHTNCLLDCTEENLILCYIISTITQ